ncbi:MAG: response regulator [Spirochaetes bacterium]|nr:response regulator [Spirochaetota bacterium]
MKQIRNIAIFIVIIFVGTYLFFTAYNEVVIQTINQYFKQQNILTEQTVSSIQNVFRNFSNSMQFLAQDNHIKNFDEPGKVSIENYFKNHSDVINGITRINEHGVIAYTYPYNESVIGKNVAYQRHNRYIINSHKPVVSDVFKAVQGYHTIAYAEPVFLNEKYTGCITVLIPFNVISHQLLKTVKQGSLSNVLLISEEGTILFAPENEFVGLKINQIFKSNNPFNTVLLKMQNGEEGSARFKNALNNRLVKHLAVYKKIDLGNTFWSMIFYAPEKDILKDLYLFRNKFLGIIILLVIVLFIYLYYFYKSVSFAVESRRRIKIESELRNTKQFLNNILKSIPSMLIVIDEKGGITHWNKSISQYSGINFREAIGKNLWKLLPYMARFKHFQSQVMHNNRRLEFHREQFDITSSRFYSITLFPLSDEINSGMVIKIDDITEIEKKELQLRQAQKMETVGTLAGGLAHDFNNVLGGIIGTLSLLRFITDKKDMVNSKELRNYIQTMENSGERATDIVNQLLTLSRKHEVNYVSVDLNTTIKHVMKICKNTFDKSVELQPIYYFEKAMVCASPTQLEQMLLNLCVNASHAMTIMRSDSELPGGQLVVGLEKTQIDEHFTSTHPDAIDKDYWLLSVRDTGVGMDAHTASLVFDPFFTTKGKGKGTGLGMTMVYNIVKQHNGFTDIYSEKGIGTTIKVHLPIFEGQFNEEEYKKKYQIPVGHGRVLVVDDEEVMRLTAQNILEECGYEVITAENGEEAVHIYNNQFQQIDLVLLDMVMPKLSGKEAFIAMQQTNPKIKAIVTSGFKEDERLTEVLNQGVREFLPKPFTMEQLSQLVYSLIHEKNTGE